MMSARADSRSSAWWFNRPECLLVVDGSDERNKVDPKVLKEITERAQKLYKQRVKAYENSLQMSKSDKDWFAQVTRDGTQKDKLAAYSMAIQDNPFYGLTHLEAVSGMARSSNRHEQLAGVEAVVDILSGNLMLPKDRKLYYLHQRPLQSQSCGDDQLAAWYFEDRLKACVFKLLEAIEELIDDPVEYTRERACRFLFDLIQAGPMEQTNNTMALLCNKLGDPYRKLSSRIIYYLEELKKVKHISKLVLIDSVRQVILRPGVPERAQYYGLLFLSQLDCNHAERLGVFSVFFKSTVVPAILKLNKRSKTQRKKAHEGQEDLPRIVKVILQGINGCLNDDSRQFGDGKVLEEFVEPLLKLCRTSSVNVAILALSLLQSLSRRVKNSGFIRNLVFTNTSAILSEHNRLAKFSNCWPALFQLIEVMAVEDLEVKPSDRLVKLFKQLVNTSVKMHSEFAVHVLVVLSRMFNKHPNLYPTMVSLPPDAITDVRESCLYELVALCKHYDPVVSAMARKLMAGESVVFENSTGVLTGKPFITAVASLHPTVTGYEDFFSVFGVQSGDKKKTKKEKKEREDKNPKKKLKQNMSDASDGGSSAMFSDGGSLSDVDEEDFALASADDSELGDAMDVSDASDAMEAEYEFD